MKSQSKAVVLLSSGLDSTVNFYEALNKFEVTLTLTFNYSQKAAAREIASAQILSQKEGVKNLVIELPWFSNFQQSSLINPTKSFPIQGEVQIENHEQSLKTAKSVWVPNRNGIFLNIAAGFAESTGAGIIIPGFNKEEASTFPDNSVDFMNALDQSFYFSTANRVKVECFTKNLNKTEILKRALELMVPLQHLWPCYDNQEKWCGVCESCLRSKRAFQENGLSPKDYFLR